MADSVDTSAGPSVVTRMTERAAAAERERLETERQVEEARNVQASSRAARALRREAKRSEGSAARLKMNNVILSETLRWLMAYCTVLQRSGATAVQKPLSKRSFISLCERVGMPHGSIVVQREPNVRGRNHMGEVSLIPGIHCERQGNLGREAWSTDEGPLEYRDVMQELNRLLCTNRELAKRQLHVS